MLGQVKSRDRELSNRKTKHSTIRLSYITCRKNLVPQQLSLTNAQKLELKTKL